MGIEPSTPQGAVSVSTARPNAHPVFLSLIKTVPSVHFLLFIACHVVFESIIFIFLSLNKENCVYSSVAVAQLLLLA